MVYETKFTRLTPAADFSMESLEQQFQLKKMANRFVFWGAIFLFRRLTLRRGGFRASCRSNVFR